MRGLDVRLATNTNPTSNLASEHAFGADTLIPIFLLSRVMFFFGTFVNQEWSLAAIGDVSEGFTFVTCIWQA
jgi:hypothetical protein